MKYIKYFLQFLFVIIFFSLFKILGLTTKSPFQDGEQPETKVDDKVEAAKKIRVEKEARIANAKPKSADFEPRKVRVE